MYNSIPVLLPCQDFGNTLAVLLKLEFTNDVVNGMHACISIAITTLLSL